MKRDQSAARTLHNEGVAQFRAGRHADACESFRQAIRLLGEDRVDVRTLKALWQAARAASDWTTSLAAGIRGAARDALDFRFVNSVMRSLHECPEAALISGSTLPWLPMPPQPPSLSVIIVSQDDQRYDAADAEYAGAFAAWPHERIRVKGAASMYGGYAHGFARSHGEIIVFSHDDIRFATPDFAARLANVMSSSDIAGIVGTTKVSGPALNWSGHPHLHGAVTHHGSDSEEFEFALASLTGPRIGNAQGLDGVFIAARRDWVERVGFDPDGIAGFHFYDLDFTYRGFRAGARLVIACDLALVHRSRGRLDGAWSRAQAAFARKFPHLRAPASEHRHFYTTALPGAEDLTRHYAKLWAAWKLRLT